MRTLSGLGTAEEPHPVQQAIANAVFDATGPRIRRAPLTRERILAALREAACT